MKLSILLYVLGVKLRAQVLMSAAFRKKIREKDCVLVIRTADGKQARSFVFDHGRFRSRAGADSAANTELVWCDSGTALKAMLSRNELDLFSAIGRSQLRILGNLDFALWFTDIAA